MITIDQARALHGIAECGSFLKAAERLGRRRSALMHSIQTLESETGLKLLDRMQYRATLTLVGKRILEECQQILVAAESFDRVCLALTTGWEPYLRILFDCMIPTDSLLYTVQQLSLSKVPTKIQIITEPDTTIEDSFQKRDAQIMISVVPPQRVSLESIKLAPIRSFLVAHKEHPLAKSQKPKSIKDLEEHRFLVSKSSNISSGFNTSILENGSTFHFNDFMTKKSAILSGIGFGWMPEYLIIEELRSKELKVIQWDQPSVQIFFPVLYHRGKRHLGKTATRFIELIMAFQKAPHCENCVPQLK